MRPPPTVRAVLAPLALLIAGPVIAGCSGDDESATSATETTGASSEAGAGNPEPGQDSAEAALAAERTVIDVRTPEEFDAGHVEDARLIDIQGPDFDAEIAELDPDVDYVVYCRSGNRSAAAAEEMRSIGLDVLDGGGLDDMSAAGWPTA